MCHPSHSVLFFSQIPFTTNQWLRIKTYLAFSGIVHSNCHFQGWFHVQNKRCSVKVNQKLLATFLPDMTKTELYMYVYNSLEWANNRIGSKIILLESFSTINSMIYFLYCRGYQKKKKSLIKSGWVDTFRQYGTWSTQGLSYGWCCTVRPFSWALPTCTLRVPVVLLPL